MSSFAFRERKSRKDVQLNVTSLIDVLFLLLIFFMLTGTFKRVGELELQLPESTSATPSDGTASHQVDLVLTEEGTLLVNGDPLPWPNLKRHLTGILEANSQAKVMIRAETGVQHGEVVRALDIVREAGFRGVGIGTHVESVPSGP